MRSHSLTADLLAPSATISSTRTSMRTPFLRLISCHRGKHLKQDHHPMGRLTKHPDASPNALGFGRFTCCDGMWACRNLSHPSYHQFALFCDISFDFRLHLNLNMLAELSYVASLVDLLVIRTQAAPRGFQAALIAKLLESGPRARCILGGHPNH